MKLLLFLLALVSCSLFSMDSKDKAPKEKRTLLELHREGLEMPNGTHLRAMLIEKTLYYTTFVGFESKFSLRFKLPETTCEGLSDMHVEGFALLPQNQKRILAIISASNTLPNDTIVFLMTDQKMVQIQPMRMYGGLANFTDFRLMSKKNSRDLYLKVASKISGVYSKYNYQIKLNENNYIENITYTKKSYSLATP